MSYIPVWGLGARYWASSSRIGDGLWVCVEYRVEGRLGLCAIDPFTMRRPSVLLFSTMSIMWWSLVTGVWEHAYDQCVV